jgi:hypothetical protein
MRPSAARGPWCDIDPALSNARILPRSASSIGTLAPWRDWPADPVSGASALAIAIPSEASPLTAESGAGLVGRVWRRLW